MFNLNLFSFSILTAFSIFTCYDPVDGIEMEQDRPMANRAIDFKTLVPTDYKLHQTFLYDIDGDSNLELLLHCTSNNKVDCHWAGCKNWFLDELLIFENNYDWKLVKTFPIHQPIEKDSNSVRLSLDSNGVLTLKKSYMPTCCSGVFEKQYFSYCDGNFCLDSLYHSAGTRTAEPARYDWTFRFDFVKNVLKYESSYIDLMDEEFETEKMDTTVHLTINQPRTLSKRIELEELMPEGIETPWY